MIINKFVFPIKADLKFVEGGIPQGYLTANDINRDMFYVISPAVGDTIISANFQNNVLNQEPVKVEFTPSSLKVSELVSENESYYELVKLPYALKPDYQIDNIFSNIDIEGTDKIFETWRAIGLGESAATHNE